MYSTSKYVVLNFINLFIFFHNGNNSTKISFALSIVKVTQGVFKRRDGAPWGRWHSCCISTVDATRTEALILAFKYSLYMKSVCQLKSWRYRNIQILRVKTGHSSDLTEVLQSFRGSTPILCENRRPEVRKQLAWPYLKCCDNSDLCNSEVMSTPPAWVASSSGVRRAGSNGTELIGKSSRINWGPLIPYSTSIIVYGDWILVSITTRRFTSKKARF